MILLALSLHSGAARAANYTVSASGGGDYASIQAAIDAASDGDTIIVAAGTYTESLDFGGKGLSVSSAEGSATTFLVGTGQYTVTFDTGEPANATLGGFTLEPGPSRGGILVQGASPTVTDVVFDGTGSDAWDGGGVEVSGGSPSFTDCTFTSTVGANGGALHVSGGAAVSLVNAWFQGSTGATGGAIYVDASTIELTDSTLYQTASAGDGGGLALVNGAQATLTDTDITETSTDSGDGFAIYADQGSLVEWSGGTNDGSFSTLEDSGYSGSVVVADGSTFNATGVTFENIVGYDAGAILYTGGAWSGAIDACTFTANSGQNGAAIQGTSSDASATLTVSGSTFTGNDASLRGGALFFDDQFTLTIEDSTFDGNTTDGQGGALYLSNGGVATLTGNTFSDNMATLGGGAITASSLGSTLTLASNLFDGNRASTVVGGGAVDLTGTDLSSTENVYSNNIANWEGGALLGDQDVAMSLSGDTFTGNDAWVGGAVYLTGSDRSPSTLTVDATTFTGNSAGYGGAVYALTVASLTIVDSTFTENEADTHDGGGVYSNTVTDQRVSNSLFCGNTAASDGGAVYTSGPTTSDTWENDIFCANTASSGGAMYLTLDAVASVVNNDFLDNTGRTGGAATFDQSAVDWRNDIVSGNSGDGVYADDAASAADSALTYDDWYDNLPSDVGGYFVAADISGSGNLTVDPAFRKHDSDGDCTDDDLHLASMSTLIDAGDPALLDADGSLSDIGAYGGDGGAAPSVDRDGDGYTDDVDCDDTDASVHPDSTEVAYDGVDQDCDGGDLVDVDGDGWPVSTDCDDTDATAYPGAPGMDTGCVPVDTAGQGETGDPHDSEGADDTAPGDTAARDSADDALDSGGVIDGFPDVSAPGSCGCASGPPGTAPGLAAAGLIVVGVRRRRRGVR